MGKRRNRTAAQLEPRQRLQERAAVVFTTWPSFNRCNGCCCLFNLYFYHHFYFPGQLVYRRFYPQQFSGQAVVTGVVPSPPRYVPSLLSRIVFPLLVDFHRMLQRTLSRSPLINFHARKSPCEYVHSVRIELTKMILVGTRITRQATGDAAA